MSRHRQWSQEDAMLVLRSAELNFDFDELSRKYFDDRTSSALKTRFKRLDNNFKNKILKQGMSTMTNGPISRTQKDTHNRFRSGNKPEESIQEDTKSNNFSNNKVGMDISNTQNHKNNMEWTITHEKIYKLAERIMGQEYAYS